MMKKILIVDDSALMRRVISDIIESDERFHVEDIAVNGLDAFDLIVTSPSKYDAVILDINMPKMNGIEFLEQIDKRKIKLTVIVVSTVAKEGAKETIRCLELGAFDFVTKPESFIEAKGDSFKSRVLDAVIAATKLYKIKPVVLTPVTTAPVAPSGDNGRIKPRSPMSSASGLKAVKRQHVSVGKNAKKLIALACSTGGPKALQQVIPKLPANLNAPVVIVQHMPEGFTNSLAQRLDEMSPLKVKEAANGDIIQMGYVYIAKGGSQLRITKNGSNYQLSLSSDEPRNGLRPCADIMYESLLDSEFDEITCVVLTGMGSDGTLGIHQLNEKKNLYVIAQNEESSVVYGMPKVVTDVGLVNEIATLDKIADTIITNVGVR